MPVVMVPEVKHARETGAGKQLFIPRALFVLSFHQIPNAANNFCRVCFPGANQTHESPCRLRHSAFAAPLELWVVVAAQRFAPTAVSVLMFFQPRDGAANIGQPHVLADD